jgi:hypothetical protein
VIGFVNAGKDRRVGKHEGDGMGNCMILYKYRISERGLECK